MTAPGFDANVPTGHRPEQFAEVKALAFPNRPTGHGEHDVALAVLEYWPAGHTLPFAAVSAAGQYRPGGAMQRPEHAGDAAPVTLPKVRGGHGEHAAAPDELN